MMDFNQLVLLTIGLGCLGCGIAILVAVAGVVLIKSTWRVLRWLCRPKKAQCQWRGPHRDRQTLYVVRGPINTILLCAGCKGRREEILRKSEMKKSEGLRSAPPKTLLAYHQN